MTNTKQKTLSALIDGEANAIEVHRLVREFGDDASLIRSWAIYRHIGGVIRSFYVGGHQPPGEREPALGPAEHRFLHNRISSAIQEETSHQASPAGRGWKRRTGVISGSLALAASLTLAVFIGFQTQVQDETPSLNEGGPQTATQDEVQPSTPGQLVDYQSVPLATPELIELDEEKQRRLRAYLDQHDRMARMNTRPQLVNYPTDPEK